MKTWDVIIVGAGPAGIFAALELTKRAPGLSVLILDKGLDLEKRLCPRQGIIGGCLNLSLIHIFRCPYSRANCKDCKRGRKKA